MNFKTCAALIALGTTLFCHSAGAQPAAASDDSLYVALGRQDGLIRLTDDFMVRLLADPRMNPFFKDVDMKVFKSQLSTQLCQVSGGPCQLKGKDMKTVHSGQDIRKSDFNSLVEVLQDSMDAQGIAFRDQNRLLARLAPMHREIVNAP